MVNGVGLVGLASAQLNAGYQPVGQRVTLRIYGTQMAAISRDGTARACRGPARRPGW